MGEYFTNMYASSADPGNSVDPVGVSESSDQELATAAAAVENDKNGLQDPTTGMIFFCSL